ncbi:tRNA (adenine22-N1)-methyltransferase [Marininema mesophilum]|uniref:tRNA (Adenine22-N1)-methyltransferase n=1 Tax=Marininema mesophilum TaxID=1048340 RepID=A0A1H2R1R4_9BACL|nr:class I SAM-dependent methyltransferase [Marininema mesophilum]SDW13412.1 tRNA (adenine22-N1)-methyltransferase [Marininema mesophilum]
MDQEQSGRATMRDELSTRLTAVARFIPQSKRVADIGADHAMLLSYLVSEGRVESGVAGEVNFGPFKNARDRVRTLGMEERISVRKGDGLEVIAPGEAEVIMIAGMGGALIASILDKGKEELVGVTRLVLQPNNGQRRLRKWLFENGWQLIAEDLIEDAGIIYDILVAESGDASLPYEKTGLPVKVAMEVGPILWSENHPLLMGRIEEALAERERILKSLASGRTPEAEVRKQHLAEEIDTWRRLLL